MGFYSYTYSLISASICTGLIEAKDKRKRKGGKEERRRLERKRIERCFPATDALSRGKNGGWKGEKKK